MKNHRTINANHLRNALAEIEAYSGERSGEELQTEAAA
jgi:hypothetical protein